MLLRLNISISLEVECMLHAIQNNVFILVLIISIYYIKITLLVAGAENSPYKVTQYIQ